jgi:hypothetical protein
MDNKQSREQVIAKLISARNDIEDALTESIPRMPSEHQVISAVLWNELSLLGDDLARVILTIENEKSGGWVV